MPSWWCSRGDKYENHRNTVTPLNQYRFGFDPWGLLLFLLVMLPNFIWFAVPAPNDILRADSVTPVVDAIGSVFQVH